jgi:RNA polymerase sigma factor (sigma-70 family)
LTESALNSLLGQLSPGDRQLIELNIFHEMKAEEVGQILGISAGNARVRFHRALKNMRKVWQAQEAGQEEKQNDE